MAISRHGNINKSAFTLQFDQMKTSFLYSTCAVSFYRVTIPDSLRPQHYPF